MADERLLTLDARGLATEVDGHSREFWTSELEVRYDQVLEQAIQPRFMDEWLDKRNGRQVDVLRSNLGTEETASKRVREKAQTIKADDDELLPYVLVQEFIKGKSKLATIGVAQKVLPPAVMELCRKGGDDGDEDYDTLALCFAIYRYNSQELRSILHLHRIHKTGFARMKMQDGPRRPKERLSSFLTANVVQDVLSRFDKSRRDGRTSEFKNVMIDGDHVLVFVRRCERPSLIMQRTQLAILRDSRAVLRYAFGHTVEAAFSTIDIGGILSNVANKFLLEGFFSVERTWRNICAVRNVSDFKTVTSYRLIGKDQYELVNPGGELKHGTPGATSGTAGLCSDTPSGTP